MTALAPVKGQDPLVRLLRLALASSSMRRELALAVLAGAGACGAGVALLATSGFLLARASLHPNIVAGATTAVLLILAPAAGVLAAGLLAAGVLVPLTAAASARRATRRAAPARGELGAAITDLLNGAAELHAFGAVETGLERARTADAELTRLARRSATASGLGAGLTAAVSGLTLWGVLLLGVAATGAGSLGRVPLAVITLTALAAFEAVTALPAAALQLGQARTAAGRIAAVADTPDPVRRPDHPFPPPERPVTVSISGGSVTYPGQDTPAVRDIDLDLEPGRRVALVGATGAGKSTVAAVLFRFAGLSGGTARLNGRDLSGYDPDDVRAVITGCAADPHIFDATIRDNLRLARPGDPGASDAELAAAADRARLLDWITSLPRGWDTPVGTHGTALSGGQRQRLALARALLADPAVLVLDEPTAHLDPENRRALTADLLAATAGRSLLLITHDLEGLHDMDEIVVLAGGRIAERGTHAELVRAGGVYQRLWHSACSRRTA